MVYHNSSGLPYSPLSPTSSEESYGHTCSDVEATVTPCYWLASAVCCYCHLSVALNLAHTHTYFYCICISAINFLCICSGSVLCTVMLFWFDGRTFPWHKSGLTKFFIALSMSCHLDTSFSQFPCVYKQMLRWFPRFQVATTCFSRSPPDLNLLVTNFTFCLHVK